MSRFIIAGLTVCLMSLAGGAGCGLVSWWSAPDDENTVYAGLRRSSYGQGNNRDDNAWWAGRTKEFAASLNDGRRSVRPAIVEIVSICLDDGSTRMEFDKPASFTGDTKNMTFGKPRGVDHEQALSIYDREGVRAVIQLESGNADVAACLELAHLAFGHHRCVIGYGVDAEWFFNLESADHTGRKITDAEAETWTKKVLSFHPRYRLFLKHWRSTHMPPTYRHPRLWFLDDSQNFETFDHMIREFGTWGRTFRRDTVGFQFGYPKDQKWWGKMSCPPREIGTALLKQTPNARFVFWVDFTAGRVRFTAGEKQP